eukprot:SAG31_NODE_1671_length_7565_cov_7.868203_1_plen_93_part_10
MKKYNERLETQRRARVDRLVFDADTDDEELGDDLPKPSIAISSLVYGGGSDGSSSSSSGGGGGSGGGSGGFSFGSKDGSGKPAVDASGSDGKS